MGIGEIAILTLRVSGEKVVAVSYCCKAAAEAPLQNDQGPSVGITPIELSSQVNLPRGGDSGLN